MRIEWMRKNESSREDNEGNELAGRERQDSSGNPPRGFPLFIHHAQTIRFIRSLSLSLSLSYFFFLFPSTSFPCLLTLAKIFSRSISPLCGYGRISLYRLRHSIFTEQGTLKPSGHPHRKLDPFSGRASGPSSSAECLRSY